MPQMDRFALSATSGARPKGGGRSSRHDQKFRQGELHKPVE
ncbi:hypothetical protein CLOSTMETH_03904 [[Clostridium] methylpentosum DSM 5476]|uniref:Uncharacterized protein n=1 Tax=[Clostridium] methylpentosum DSM 5476 TaxID=537013 RepID=C0EJ58_9FIRM|nr:hypothetical protein CLOSTMETH_03904 [[Clostridium] methylpentosum DSM 5476]